MRLRGCYDNLARVFDQADDIDLTAGRECFSSYHVMMQEMSSVFGYPIESVTAAFVSLSPNTDYLKNLRSVVTLLQGHRRGLPVEGLTVSTYGHCKLRAWQYINGLDFLSVTKGPKITAFYKSIINPEDPIPVVVDGHMVSAWCYRRMNMKTVASNMFDYGAVAEDIRALAGYRGLIPCQAQGVLWFTWKRINQVVYKSNLDIYGDHWQLKRGLDDIKPYPDRNILPIQQESFSFPLTTQLTFDKLTMQAVVQR